MMTAVWATLGVMVYLVGWIISTAIAERDCKKDDHEHCSHALDASVWPFILAVMVVIIPLYYLGTGVKRAGHWLAEYESPRKVRARREAEAVAASEARIAALKERTRQLEIENDIPPMWSPPTDPESDPVRRKRY